MRSVGYGAVVAALVIGVVVWWRQREARRAAEAELWAVATERRV